MPPTSQPTAGEPKATWRRWARTLPPVPPRDARRVVGRLAETLAGVDGPVLGYVALPDEVRIAGLEIPVLCLPRLGEDGAMTLHLDDGSRERHRIGVEQPPAGLPTIDPGALAAVLVPGRIFDRDGFRLGRGGGHYDRLVPRLDPGTPVIGIATEARIVDRLPREPHDRPMSHLVTEQRSMSIM